MFNYEGVTDTRVAGLISRTKCKPVHIDPCQYSLSYCNSSSKANSYLLTLIPSSFVPILGKNIFFRLPNYSCVIIQIGNQLLKTVTLQDFFPNCLPSYLAGCSIEFSPMNWHGHISSIKGELFSPKYLPTTQSSKIVIYTMKRNELLAPKDFPNSISLRMQNFNPKFEHFEPVSSAAVSISVNGRTVDWVDIVVRSNYSVSFINPFEHIHKVNSGINLIPRITDYGSALYSSADTFLMLVNNTWQNEYTGLTTYFEVKIKKGISLSHKNYYIYHGEHNFIFSDFVPFESLVHFI